MSAKVVAVSGDAVNLDIEVHQGRPRGGPRADARPVFASGEHFGVSGALGNITDVAALRRAMGEIDRNFDAVAPLGGESFLAHSLSGGMDCLRPLAQFQQVRREAFPGGSLGAPLAGNGQRALARSTSEVIRADPRSARAARATPSPPHAIRPL